LGGDRGGRSLGDRGVGGSRIAAGQRRRIGVEAEADLAAALVDKRR
jgi:hypothetical protein